MKQSDFDRLKAVCEKEGFEILNESATDNDKFFVVKKAKDIWDGVEFVEFTKTKQIHKVKSKTETHIISENGPTRWKCEFNPSTESAYIDQLKTECFKRFGEIKEGDRFELNREIGKISDLFITSWIYRKETDSFGKHGTVLYQHGKWATRVKERVKVEGIDSGGLGKNKPEWEYNFKFKISDLREEAKTMHNKVLPFLASKLEEYLNK